MGREGRTAAAAAAASDEMLLLHSGAAVLHFFERTHRSLLRPSPLFFHPLCGLSFSIFGTPPVFSDRSSAAAAAADVLVKTQDRWNVLLIPLTAAANACGKAGANANGELIKWSSFN